MFFDLQVFLHIKVSCFWTKVSTLYTMGVHGVCVVSALLFKIVPLKSSKNNENHLKISDCKEICSLQNGRAYRLVAGCGAGVLYKMGLWISRSPKVLYKMTRGIFKMP